MKKLIITLLCLAIVAGGIYFGTKEYKKKQFEKLSVDVVPVSTMLQPNWNDYNNKTYGYVSAGNAQTINQNETYLVKKVLVKQGDKVEVGTPLVEYDLTLIDLEVSQRKNDVDIAQDDIKIAERELKRLQGLKPSEDEPKPQEPTEPETPDPEPEPEIPEEPEVPDVETVLEIKADTTPTEGKGTKEEPFIFNCSSKTVVKKEYLTTLMNKKQFAKFVIYSDDNTPLFAWIVDGSALLEENLVDVKISSLAKFNDDNTVEFTFSDKFFGEIALVPNTDNNDSFDDTGDDNYADDFTDDFGDDIFDDFDDNNNADDTNISDDYMYSRAELAKMISEQQSEIKSLEIAKKAADIEYKKILQTKKDGVVYSTIKGTVKSVQDIKDLNPDEPFMIVQGGGGLTINSEINESQLREYEVGSEISIEALDTGEVFTATISEIKTDSVKSTSNDGWGGSNPNNSSYELKADISEDSNLKIYSGVMISFGEAKTDNSKYLPLTLIREDDGKNYVMITDEDKKLKKQYIKTGKILYGYMIEIQGGLKSDDYICFPYGKNVKEGVKTKEVDYLE